MLLMMKTAAPPRAAPVMQMIFIKKIFLSRCFGGHNSSKGHPEL